MITALPKPIPFLAGLQGSKTFEMANGEFARTSCSEVTSAISDTTGTPVIDTVAGFT